MIIDIIALLLIVAQWFLCKDYDEIDTEQKRQANEGVTMDVNAIYLHNLNLIKASERTIQAARQAIAGAEKAVQARSAPPEGKDLDSKV